MTAVGPSNSAPGTYPNLVPLIMPQPTVGTLGTAEGRFFSSSPKEFNLSMARVAKES